jgi:hypothetical protein
MNHDGSGTHPPGWQVSTAREGIRFADGSATVVLEATPTRSDPNRWRLVCSANDGGVEYVDEFGTVRSRDVALDALRSAAWLVHRHGIDAEHVGVSLDRDGENVTWRGWQFE